MLLLAEKATPGKVRTMRKDAGGLICVSVGQAHARRMKLRFATQMLEECKIPLLSRMGRKKMPYGDMPAFSISINHLSTFTGISYIDRAKTIREFGKLAKRNGTARDLKKSFRAIGHVFLLIGRGLEKRRGHTELSLALAHAGGMDLPVALCEMLSDTGRAASREEARAYAERHGIPFLEGKELLAAIRSGGANGMAHECGLC